MWYLVVDSIVVEIEARDALSSLLNILSEDYHILNSRVSSEKQNENETPALPCHAMQYNVQRKERHANAHRKKKVQTAS
jgi:hypothetical protein